MTDTVQRELSDGDDRSQEVLSFVTQYLEFAKKSAENVLNLAETLYTAKETLAPVDFRHFCKDVRLVEDGSTFKKLMKIGERMSRFSPHIDRMPSSWTTVYKLATLDPGEFDRVAKSDRFGPLMTAKEISEILHGDAGKKKSNRDLLIDLSALEKPEKVKIYHAIQKMAKEHGFAFDVGRDFRHLLDAPPRPITEVFYGSPAAGGQQ